MPLTSTKSLGGGAQRATRVSTGRSGARAKAMPMAAATINRPKIFSSQTLKMPP